MADEDMAAEVVKSRIKEIISKEDSSSPYSDQQIVNILSKEGVVIARRTIAKYREVLGILPSSQRKKPY
jgi:RNA polymerase sigma-54 factor